MPSNNGRDIADNTVTLSKATFHQGEEPATFNYNMEKTRQPMESQTHSMVLVDSPDNSPAAPHKDYETQSDSLKFHEELPEWESMDIQLRIDPSGKQEPVITRREKPRDDDNDSLPSDDSFEDIPDDYPAKPAYQTPTTPSQPDVRTTSTTVVQELTYDADNNLIGQTERIEQSPGDLSRV
ncbi:uncharacterized protein [Clytia hemisphaerica]|uniref:uncharacterized protein n=1 Tax=Clytia hemisphaerica TaxID=252671 RepID=UPI0034D3935F